MIMAVRSQGLVFTHSLGAAERTETTTASVLMNAIGPSRHS